VHGKKDGNFVSQPIHACKVLLTKESISETEEVFLSKQFSAFFNISNNCTVPAMGHYSIRLIKSIKLIEREK
jgi:hypothetical protein